MAPSPAAPKPISGAPLDSNQATTIAAIAAKQPQLQMLLLHGSRAGRGPVRADSDWDFAYLTGPKDDGPPFDPAALLADLVAAIGSEAIDLADLDRAGALLRFRVARDGVLLYEREPGTYERFWLTAVHFWCDAGPIIRRGYEANLEEIGR